LVTPASTPGNAGKDHILSINKPGDFINLLHIFSEKNFRYNIVALEDTLVCDVDLGIINHLIKSNGNFAMTVINRMSNISAEIIENRFNMIQKQIKGRIASLILYFADEVYHSDTFTLPITRKEIGELISITTENTIRSLSVFHNDGIIRLKGKQLEILNKDLLKIIKENG
jgi:CRP/FNR family transcriptional regulator